MIRRGAVLVTAIAVAATCALALPQAAWAHAALLRTDPTASGTVETPPTQVTLTYDEAVAPKFAVISVTDAAGHQETTAAPAALPSDPDTIAVPVRHLDEGWYLVYWRVISADGHPVRGAFTFAVGPNPGPAPQFVIPSLSESAATPQLVVTRWLVFISMLLAAGLFAMRVIIARPVAAVAGPALRTVSIALGVALAVALVAIPVYVLVATAGFAQRPWTDLAATVPVVRDSNLGRSFEDLELVLALFAAAAAATLWVDTGARRQRSTATLLALAGALLAGGAALAVPGLAGHAAQTSPAALSLVLDWTHLAAVGVWLGGLAGLLILALRSDGDARMEVLGLVVPRFSRVAVVSVLLVIATGVGASLIHLPTLSSLWGTSYGQAILVKVALLAAALVAGGINNARTTPRLRAALERARPQPGGVRREPAAAHLAGRGGARVGDRARGDGALEPAAACEGARRGRPGERARRPGRRRPDVPSWRLHGARARRPQPGGAAEHVHGHPQPGRPAGDERERRAPVRHAGHGDGHAVLHDAAALAGHVRAHDAGARDGGPLGRQLRDPAERPTAVHDHRRRPCGGMT